VSLPARSFDMARPGVAPPLYTADFVAYNLSYLILSQFISIQAYLITCCANRFFTDLYFFVLISLFLVFSRAVLSEAG